MDTSTPWFQLLILAGLAVLLVVLVLFAVQGKRIVNQYDERQKLARGKAAKAAFVGILLYLGLDALLQGRLGLVWCTRELAPLMAASCGLLIYGLLCIRWDAYVALNEKSGRSLMQLAVIGAINLALGIWSLCTPGYCFTDGLLNIHVLNLILGVLLCVMVVFQFLRNQRQKRDEQAEG